MPSQAWLDERAALVSRFFGHVPHNVALGVTIDALRPSEAELRLPWKPALVGDPTRGVLHGGAITALLDATAGAAVFMALRDPVPIATLDLRIDYLQAAVPHRDVVARAVCHRVTRHVAFARGEAVQRDEDGTEHAVALANGSFMVGTKRGDANRVRDAGEPA